MAELLLHFIGPPQIVSNSALVSLTRRKGIALLAYLAVMDLPQSRDTLATLLWPGYDQSSARGHLRRTLYAMKTVIGGHCLTVTHSEIGLATNKVWADVGEFNRLFSRRHHHDLDASELAHGLRIYRGDFLQGFSVDDSPEFDTWQRQEAEMLRAMFAAGSEALIAKLHISGANGEAVQAAQHCLAHIPSHEPAHRALMELYARAGRRPEALQQFARCRDILRTELDVEPDAATQTPYDRIRRGEALSAPVLDNPTPSTDSASIKAMVAELARPQFTIPILPTAFVPRTEELQAIKARLLDPTCRLLVLLGPGGVGKTYLATQIAHDLVAERADFPDGIYWIDLTGYDTPDAVPSAVADALGVRFSGDSSEVSQIATYLTDKSLLLVLDNFEHVIEAANLVAGIMTGAAYCKLLITSRIALQLRGEWLLTVEGMRYPDAMDPVIHAADAQLNEFSAIRLFFEAGRRHRNHFSLQENAASIIRICQLVGGMPLALELAATWLKSMSCEEIVERLAADIGLLSTRQRDVPVRHASIQNVFDYSWRLLTTEQQRALARLSVLQGRFGFEAAEAVASATREDIEGLIEHSFLHRVESASGYTIHELLRQFAASRLAGDPALLRAVREKHADHYARFLAARTQSVNGPNQERILKELNARKDNIRAAWRWSASNGHVSALETMLAPLFEFYFVRGLIQEGVGAAEEALAQPALSNLNDRLLAKLHNRAAHCQFYLGDQARSLYHASASLEHALRAGALDEEALALRLMGMNATVQDDFVEAIDYFTQALDLDRQLHNRPGEAITLFEMGRTELDIGSPQLARQHFEQSLAISRQLERHRWIAYALDMLAFADFNLGNFERSAHQFDEALHLFRALGDRRGIGKTLGGAARARLRNGTGSIRSVMEDGDLALHLFAAIGDRREVSGRLYILAHVALYDAGDVVAARDYIDRTLQVWTDWPEYTEHARVLLTAGLVATFERDFVRARTDTLTGLRIFQSKANAQGIGEGVAHLAFLMANGIDFRADATRNAEACKLDAVKWLTAVQLKSPAYYWIHLRDWVEYHLELLESELPSPLFAQAQSEGQGFRIEEVAREIMTHLEIMPHSGPNHTTRRNGQTSTSSKDAN